MSNNSGVRYSVTRLFPIRCLTMILLVTVILATGTLQGTTAVADTGPTRLLLVVHESNALTEISRKEASEVFLKKKSSIRGQTLIPFNLPADDEVRHLFDRLVHKQTTNKIEDYWLERKIKMKNTEPRVVPNPVVMFYFIEQFTNGIGYLTQETWMTLSGELKESVKPLAVRTKINGESKTVHWKSDNYPFQGRLENNR